MPRFRIDNMGCGGCARGVTVTLQQADPAARIEIALERREAVVTTAAAAETLQAALLAAGWKASLLPA